jgi:predicted esterase
VIRESHLEVPRTARIFTLGEASPAIRQVWLACHGYGQLASRFLRRFEPLADASRLIVAPEALNRFYIETEIGPHGADSRVGAAWMTREDRLNEIEDYVRYLEAVREGTFRDLADGAPVKLVALGFSQGVSTVVRWAARTTAAIERLVLWAGSWPPEIEPRPGLFRGAPIDLVAGTTDSSVSEAAVARLCAALEAGGLEPHLIRFAGSHVIDGDVLRAIAGGLDGP